MTAATLPRPVSPRPHQAILIGSVILSALTLAAMARQMARGGTLLPSDHTIWLTLHLATVIPALPLGAYVLLRRKGDRAHRLLGRTWAVLMLVGALSSFGLHSMFGRVGPIHLLSILVLVGVPRAVMLAMRGDIAGHRRTVLRVHAGLLVAGAFTFMPGRLPALWLFG